MSQYRVSRLDRNHRRVLRTCFVRANSEQQAKQIGREILGKGPLVANIYRPERDPAFVGFIQQMQEQ